MTRQLTADTRIENLIPSRWIRVPDLIEAGRSSVTLTVTGISLETVMPRPGREETKPALTFRETEKMYLISTKADLQTLAEHYAATVGQLIGTKIVIGLATYNSNPVLRIQTPPTDRPKPKPAPKQPEPEPEPEKEPEPEPEPAIDPDADWDNLVANTDKTNGKTSKHTATDKTYLWPPNERWVVQSRQGTDWISSFWSFVRFFALSPADAQAALAAGHGDFETALELLYKEQV